MRLPLVRNTLQLSGALLLATSLLACGKKDAAAEGDAPAAEGDAPAAGGDAPAPTVAADPELASKVRKVLDGFGDCTLGGKKLDPEEDKPEALRLEGWEFSEPEGCDAAFEAYDALLDANVDDDAKAKALRDALLANLDHPKPAARYMAVTALFDLPDTVKTEAAQIQAMGGFLNKETVPQVAGNMSEFFADARIEGEAEAKAYGEILKSTNNQVFIDATLNSWSCTSAACAQSVLAWAENPNAAIRAASFEELVNLDEEVVADAQLCELLAKSLGHEEPALVAEASRRIFDVGEACKPKVGEVVAQLDKHKADAKAHGELFVAMWDSGYEFEGAEQAKMLEHAKAIVAAKPEDADLMSAAEGCVSEYGG